MDICQDKNWAYYGLALRRKGNDLR